MKWKDKLKEWLNKNPLKYPKNIKSSFFWETKCLKSFNDEFEEEFIENKSLTTLSQNYSSFIEYISKSKNKYATSFFNPSKTTLLIIPMPRDNKKFTTIKDFIDNASLNHQQEFWKYVAKVIIKFKKDNKEIYISTHGLGVPYLHIRLDLKPKYYTGKFKN